ncbi:MAG: acyloxyacyl hydrolase [Nitrospira sp.]|jgi:lipid A 3-O-deacylase|nr:acyloxyacyl hydrolase [Nitrospira sp.]
MPTGLIHDVPIPGRRLVRTTFGLIVTLLLMLCGLMDRPAAAEDLPASTPVGTHTIGMAAGPFFPVRVLSSQSSKLFGEAVMPSWRVTLTEPIGSGWYQGQLALGAEIVAFHTNEPITAYGIGFTPKLVYTSTAFGRVRPFLEAGGGPVWTDLGGRVPEQPGQFNFLVWGGAGCSYHMTRAWTIDAGYRVMHISNAGTRQPNSGLNFGLPFLGLSYQGF